MHYKYTSSIARWLLCVGISLSAMSALAQQFGDVLSIGDSLTAGLAGTSGGTLTCAALGGIEIAPDQQRSCRGDGREGVGGWQPRLKSHLSSQVFNYGSSGEFTSEMLARIDANMNRTASDYVLILGGTNDMIRSVSTSTTITNLKAMIDAVLEQGRTPIIATAPPLLGGRFNSINSRIIALNDQIRQLPTQYKGLVVAEIYNQVASNWSNYHSGDTIHFGTNGNRLVADIWFASIQATQLTSSDVNIVPILLLLLED